MLLERDEKEYAWSELRKQMYYDRPIEGIALYKVVQI